MGRSSPRLLQDLTAMINPLGNGFKVNSRPLAYFHNGHSGSFTYDGICHQTPSPTRAGSGMFHLSSQSQGLASCLACVKFSKHYEWTHRGKYSLWWLKQKFKTQSTGEKQVQFEGKIYFVQWVPVCDLLDASMIPDWMVTAVLLGPRGDARSSLSTLSDSPIGRCWF